MKTKQKLKRLFSFVIGLMLVTSCSKDDGNTLSNLAGITEFKFIEDAISNYSFEIKEDDKSKNTYIIENKDLLPYGFDASGLIAEFVAIKGSKITVNGVIQISSKTKNDFTKEVVYTVTAEDGVTKKTYTIKLNISQVNPEEVQWNQLNPSAFDEDFENREYFFLKGKHWIVAGKTFKWFGTTAPETKLYSSTDGKTWNEETPTGDFPVGFHHNIVVREGVAYVVGLLTGKEGDASMAPTLQNHLYTTSDGLAWTKVDDALDNSRILSPAMNLKNTIYAFGGNGTAFGNTTRAKPTDAPFFPPVSVKSTTLVSTDGTTFTPTGDYTTEMPKRVRSAHYVYNDKMYIAGGLATTGFALDDVWSSTDGETWTKVSEGAFSKRQRASTVVYDNKIWMFGGLLEDGTCASEVLVSEDAGVTWNPVEAFQALPAEFTARCDAEVTVDAEGNILIFGGQSTTVDAASGAIEFTTLTDVWSGKLNKL